MSIKKYLLTGANGFIGTRLLVALNKNEYDIRVLSRKSLPKYESVCCDFLRDQIPSSALTSIDTVFHLAGFAHDFRNTEKVDAIYQAINVDATVKLAELAIKNKVKTFIFVSSVKAGGKSYDNKCMSESDQGEPEGVYGKTKREAEIKLLEMSLNSDMDIVIIRPSLVYGKGMKGNLHLMFSGIKKGWFPPLPKIKNRRSMIHVDDLVQALIMVSKEERARNEIFIVTDGHPYSSREIYETMCNILNKSIPLWSVPSWLLNFMSKFNKTLQYKIDKLIGDEWYSSEKIESIGFEAKISINKLDENEAFF